MGIDEAWEQGTPGKVHDRGFGTNTCGDLSGSPNCRDASILHGDGFCSGVAMIHSQNVSAQQDELHRLPPDCLVDIVVRLAPDPLQCFEVRNRLRNASHVFLQRFKGIELLVFILQPLANG
jgi:hypothetical protein